MAHSTLLLDAHLKALHLPTFLREYGQSGAALRPGRAGLSAATCSASASWSCSIASSAPSSGASRPPSSRS